MDLQHAEADADESSPYFSSSQKLGSEATDEAEGNPRPHVLGQQFFAQPCHALAKVLLGKILVRQLANGTLIKGKIVETESYPGDTDRASHSFKGQTDRNSAMFDKAGTAYVYLIYGMYHCFNISALEPGAGVLIRALEPVDGIDTMRTLRKGGTDMKLNQLCNGPGRLCQAFNITTPAFNKHYLPDGQDLWLESHEDTSSDVKVVECTRVGINSYGAEWAKKPWRYYVMGSDFISKRDRASEAKSVLAEETVAAASSGGGSAGAIRKKGTNKPRTKGKL